MSSLVILLEVHLALFSGHSSVNSSPVGVRDFGEIPYGDKHPWIPTFKQSSLFLSNPQYPEILQNSDMAIQRSNVLMVMKMLPRLLTKIQWKVLNIIHDISVGTDTHVVNLCGQLNSLGIMVSTFGVYPNTSSEDIHYSLSNNYNQVLDDQRNFFILCKDKCLSTVMEQINQFDHHNNNRTAFWKFSKWLIYSDQLEEENISANLRVDNFAVVHVSSKQIMDSTTECSKIYVPVGKIYTVLYKAEGRQLSLVGTFDVSGSVRLTSDVFPNVHFGFNGKMLTIGTNIWYPFVMKTSPSSSPKFEGLCLDLLTQLGSILNFTYEVVLPPDGEWGTIVNGSWTGLVRGLQNHDLDMVIAPMTVTPERETVMDFSFPFYHDRGIGIYKQSERNEQKWTTLIKPFKSIVFVYIVMCMVGAAVLLFIIEERTWTYKPDDKVGRPSRKSALLDVFLYIYGSILTRGKDIPLSTSGRILVGFWWLFCIVIAASYCGNLIAFLAVSKSHPPFETLAEIAAQTKYKWGTAGGTSWITYFKTSNSSTVKDLWTKMEQYAIYDPDVLSPSPDVHKEKVLSGYYIYFGNKDTLRTWTTADCKIELTKETFYPYVYAVGLPKNSPFKDIVSASLLQIEETGLISKWKQKWWPRDSGVCLRHNDSNSKVIISLEDMQSAFYSVALGLALASLTLAVERLYLYQRYSRQNSTLSN